MVLSLTDAEQGRLCQIDMPFLHKRFHKAEKEGQQKRTDVGAVDVGIRHNDNFTIAQFGEVEFLANPTAQCCDNRHQLFISVHLIQTSLFNVQHFAP